MDILLIVLGILGLATIVVSAYVFTIAARNYVSSDDPGFLAHGASSADPSSEKRQLQNRRNEQSPNFPLNIDGVTIARERRRQPERRSSDF